MSLSINVRRINSRKINRDRHRLKKQKKVDLSQVTDQHERIALRSNPHANTTMSKKRAKRLERMTRFQPNSMSQ